MSDTNLAVPAHLQNNDEAAKRALQDAASMSAASNSIPRISLRGREFRFIESGEEIKKVRDKVRVVILGVEPEGKAMIKAWYAKGYVSGAKEPPDCASDDGISPAPYVQNRQSTLCATCEKNRFGSATSPSGKATKACRDSKRIWVVEAEIFVAGKWEPVDIPLDERTQYGLNVTVASLKSFAELGRVLAGYGQSPAVAVTELEMMDKEYPELKFNLVGWLSAVDAPLSLAVNTKRPWKVYNSAALALDAPTQSASSLPMQLPDHLKQPATSPAVTVVGEVTEAKVAHTNQQIQDAVGNW